MNQIIDADFLSMLETHDLQIRSPMKGLFGGNRKSSSYGSSTEFADFREYTPGDDLRRIDWNLYGRFDKLFLKLFVDERQLHHRIYLDASSSMDWGEPKKAETALKIAAALGFLSVQSMDRVSFYTVHEQSCEEVCLKVTGREGFYKAVPRLNKIRFYGSSDIGSAFEKIENPGEGDGVSVLISDFLTDSDFKSAVDFLLYHHREVHLIQVLSEDEIAPSMRGKLLMLDSEALDEEDGRNYKTEVTKASIKAYTEAFCYHQKDIRDFCASRGVGFFSVSSDESIEEILFQKAMEAGTIR